MTRQLASIQKIIDIQPIEGADKISVATVLGWQVVIAKSDNFKIGDLIVYIEVDSIMPAAPQYEFLKERKYRVRTIKLRKQVSQGLILPINSVLPAKRWKEGQDVTNVLGVIKYDPQLEKEMSETSSQSKNPIVKFLMRFAWYRKYFVKRSTGGFPSWIIKTDEDRIQSKPKLLDNEKDTVFEVTEKLDGQSVTYYLKKNGRAYDFGVCSRTQKRSVPDNSSYWTIARKYEIENVLKTIIGDADFVVMQGEIIGEGIQGNKYGISGYDLFVFNLIYPNVKLKAMNMVRALSQFDIKVVPIIDDNFHIFETMEENVNYANGKSYLRNSILREGVVIRNYEKDISFKIISPQFLLKNDE